jgi:hypothetical protein
VTPSSRYDALRAATVGAYGFDACVLAVLHNEPSIIDAAAALLARIRVGLITNPAFIGNRTLPSSFCVIDAALIGHAPFPTDWITRVPAALVDPHITQHVEIPAAMHADAHTAQRRLKGLARRAQRELGAVGFPGEPRLDLLAALEDEIAWASASDTGFGIVLIHVGHRDNAPPAEIEKVLNHFETCLRGVVRSADTIAQGTDSLMALITEATPEGTSLVANRAKKAVRAAQKDAGRDKRLARFFDRITLGFAAYPSHGTTRASLLARATAAAISIERSNEV